MVPSDSSRKRRIMGAAVENEIGNARRCAGETVVHFRCLNYIQLGNYAAPPINITLTIDNEASPRH